MLDYESTRPEFILVFVIIPDRNDTQMYAANKNSIQNKKWTLVKGFHPGPK